MKGLLHTVSIFLIFLGLVAYVNIINQSTTKTNAGVSEKISAERIFYAWSGVHRNIGNIMNISSSKDEYITEINDTLPAERDIDEMLDDYGRFIDKYLKDETMDIYFDDGYGNRVEPEDMESNLVIKPMNISYSWTDWSKREMLLSTYNNGFIKNISLFMKITNTKLLNDTTAIIWEPYKNCRSGYPCLNFYLTVSDGEKTISSTQTTFDLSRSSKTEIYGINGGWIRIRIGPWFNPDDVIRIELQNINITTSTKLILNATEFYISYPTKLAVVTDFARKVD